MLEKYLLNDRAININLNAGKRGRVSLVIQGALMTASREKDETKLAKISSH